MDIGFILTVVFGIIGAISFVIAIMQNKKAKTAEQKIVDLEKAITSYSYLKDKAYGLYSNGKYEESLDVFKKYLSGNMDEKEWTEIINCIFKKETEKIYSSVLTFKDGVVPGIASLFIIFISFEGRVGNVSPYPEIIKDLINTRNKKFECNNPKQELLIALFEKKWERAKDYLQTIRFAQDEDLDISFKQFITLYLNKKLGITDEIPIEDIPF